MRLTNESITAATRRASESTSPSARLQELGIENPDVLVDWLRGRYDASIEGALMAAATAAGISIGVELAQELHAERVEA